MNLFIHLIIVIALLSGCSYSKVNADEGIPIKETAFNQWMPEETSQETKDERTNPANLLIDGAEKVVWNHKEVSNLDRLAAFIDHVQLGVEDRITVATSTKEGEPIIRDLSYDGARLVVATNGEQKEYSRIFVTDRFNEHYQGTFIEYWVSDADGKKELILQIGPNTAVHPNEKPAN